MDIFSVQVSGGAYEEAYECVVGIYDSFDKAEEQALKELKNGNEDFYSEMDSVKIVRYNLNERDFGTNVKVWDNYDDGNGFQVTMQEINGNVVFYDKNGNALPPIEWKH